MPINSSGFGSILKELEGASIPQVDTLSEVPSLQTGIVYVKSVRDFFVKRDSNSRPVDGIEVLTGGWERLNIPHPSWAYETALYVDPENGSDENPGTSDTSPVKTFAELIRRLGSVYSVRTQQVIYLMGDCSEDVSWSIDCTGGSLVIQCATKVLGTGTISGNVNVNTNNHVLPNHVPSFAVEENTLLFNHRNNSWTWVLEDMGSGRVRTCRWRGVSTDLQPSTALQALNSANGDTITALGLTELSGVWSLRVRATPPAITNHRFFALNYGVFTKNGTFNCQGAMFLQRCKFDAEPEVTGNGVYFENCLFMDGFGVGSVITKGVDVQLYYGATKNPLYILTGQVWLRQITTYATVFWNSFVRIDAGCLRASDIGVFNSTGDAIQVNQRGVATLSGSCYGSGSAGFGVNIAPGGNVHVTATTTTITGNAGDIGINGVAEAFAIDPDTGLPVTPKRATTWANKNATFANGGFGGRIIDPVTGAKVL